MPVVPGDVEDAAPQLDLLRDLGFNVVRLLVIWKALEPGPQENPAQLSVAGRQYLEGLLPIMDALYSRGLFVFIDFHQDIAHEIYGGDGFPDWALANDFLHPLPAPADMKDKTWQANYAIWTTVRARSCRHTLASFWKNSLVNERLSENQQNIARHVRTHFVATVGAVAAWFQALNDGNGHPAILGY